MNALEVNQSLTHGRIGAWRVALRKTHLSRSKLGRVATRALTLAEQHATRRSAELRIEAAIFAIGWLEMCGHTLCRQAYAERIPERVAKLLAEAKNADLEDDAA